MARPSEFCRQEAIALAMNEIWRDGYEANSVKSLSEKMGITRSSFYNAFGSREALYKDVLALYLAQSPDQALTKANPDVSVKKLFTETFRNVCKWRSQDPEARGCLAINGVTELCNTNDELGAMLEAMVLGSVTRIEMILRRGVTSGEIDARTDTRALALSLQNLLVGLNVMSKVVRTEADLWLATRTTLRGLDMLAEP